MSTSQGRTNGNGDTMPYQAVEEREVLNSPAYELRAHHLNKIMHFMQVGVDQSTVDFISAREEEEDGPISGPAYAADIFGTTDSERERVTARHRTIFDAFSNLSDDTVMSLTKLPDEICKACILGQHCSSTQPDWLVMEEFMRCVDRIERQRGERTSKPYVRKIDEEGRLAAVVTTKKTVAAVIAYILTPVKRSGVNP